MDDFKRLELSFKSKIDELAISVEKLDMAIFGRSKEFETKTLAMEVYRKRLADTEQASKVDIYDYIQILPIKVNLMQRHIPVIFIQLNLNQLAIIA